MSKIELAETNFEGNSSKTKKQLKKRKKRRKRLRKKPKKSWTVPQVMEGGGVFKWKVLRGQGCANQARSGKTHKSTR